MMTSMQRKALARYCQWHKVEIDDIHLTPDNMLFVWFDDDTVEGFDLFGNKPENFNPPQRKEGHNAYQPICI